MNSCCTNAKVKKKNLCTEPGTLEMTMFPFLSTRSDKFWQGQRASSGSEETWSAHGFRFFSIRAYGQGSLQDYQHKTMCLSSSLSYSILIINIPLRSYIGLHWGKKRSTELPLAPSYYMEIIRLRKKTKW